MKIHTFKYVQCKKKKKALAVHIMPILNNYHQLLSPYAYPLKDDKETQKKITRRKFATGLTLLRFQ